MHSLKAIMAVYVKGDVNISNMTEVEVYFDLAAIGCKCSMKIIFPAL